MPCILKLYTAICLVFLRNYKYISDIIINDFGSKKKSYPPVITFTSKLLTVSSICPDAWLSCLAIEEDLYTQQTDAGVLNDMKVQNYLCSRYEIDRILRVVALFAQKAGLP